MEATLVIHNHLGKLVKTYKGDYKRGYNELNLTEADLSAGVYYYTLKTNGFTATKNMIFIE